MAAPTVPTTFPSYLVAGATWQWEQALYDQATGDVFAPDDGGTVTMRLLGSHSLSFTATADTADDVWSFSVASTTTDDITATTGETYAWRITGVLSGITYDLGAGTIYVHPNPALAYAGVDRRSHAQRMVPLIEAEIEARVTGDGSGHNRYQIATAAGTREIEKLTLTELRGLRAGYQTEAGGRPKPFAMYFAGTHRQ